MASVTRRRFGQRLSTVSLLEGSVDVTLIQRVAKEGKSLVRSVQVSVWEMIEDVDRDRMERYVFELSAEEAKKLIKDLSSHFGEE